MQIADNPVVNIRSGPLPDMKRLRDTLEAAGIEARILKPESCGTSS